MVRVDLFLSGSEVYCSFAKQIKSCRQTVRAHSPAMCDILLHNKTFHVILWIICMQVMFLSGIVMLTRRAKMFSNAHGFCYQVSL